jgi:hypothetical protein
MELLALTATAPDPVGLRERFPSATLLECYRAVPGADPVLAGFGGAVRLDGAGADGFVGLDVVTVLSGSSRRLRRRAPAAASVRPETVPGVVVVFAFARRSDLSPAEFDAYWRDGHGPTALRHHVGMDDYVQWTVSAVVEAGPLGPIDGVSLCGFPTVEDRRDRFFDDDAGRAVIEADARRFVSGRTLRSLDCTVEVLVGP